MTKAFAQAFAEWDRRYRANPDEFLSMCDGTSESYGEVCAAYFQDLLTELGLPDETVTAVEQQTTES